MTNWLLEGGDAEPDTGSLLNQVEMKNVIGRLLGDIS